jgi:para-aminobenzoate synthetase component 1
MKTDIHIAHQMNSLGKEGKPFAFLIDFLLEKPRLFALTGSSDSIWWQIPGFSNVPEIKKKPPPGKWQIKPVSFEEYQKGFGLVKQHIYNGDTYLLNFTQPTQVETDLALEDIFHAGSAPYKIFLKNGFVSFSPEPFVRIKNGRIFSFPMKGTIDAGIKNAKELVLNDSKELAEHNTIVDLIRNDLSLVAENVTVEKFRYLDFIQTNRKNLWQVSSQIAGNLPKDYAENIGDIMVTLLPAGSVSGAPKKKTVEIIRKAENYDRGYYTGIFGIFDGMNLESCVLIRYLENQNGQFIYKSGGGITFMSDAEKEYQEMIEKVYVPV